MARVEAILLDAKLKQCLPLCGQVLALGRAVGISDFLPVHLMIPTGRSIDPLWGFTK